VDLYGNIAVLEKKISYYSLKLRYLRKVPSRVPIKITEGTDINISAVI